MSNSWKCPGEEKRERKREGVSWMECLSKLQTITFEWVIFPSLTLSSKSHTTMMMMTTKAAKGWLAAISTNCKTHSCVFGLPRPRNCAAGRGDGNISPPRTWRFFSFQWWISSWAPISSLALSLSLRHTPAPNPLALHALHTEANLQLLRVPAAHFLRRSPRGRGC